MSTVVSIVCNEFVYDSFEDKIFFVDIDGRYFKYLKSIIISATQDRGVRLVNLPFHLYPFGPGILSYNKK